MTTTPDTLPPFARHQKTAEVLLQTLAQALQPTLAEKGALSADDLARAVELMLRHKQTLAPLFAVNCRACLAAGPAAAVKGMAAFQADQRRRDYVTRLLFAAVAAQTPETVDPITGDSYPRLLAGPLQTHVASLFYEREWEAMNADALLLFQKVGVDSGEAVWERLQTDDALPFVADAVFIRVLLRFRQFAYQRQHFIRRMGDLLRDRQFIVTEAHFIALFDAMFGRLRPALASELGRARIDTRYGEETATTMLRIFDEFDRRRLELASSFKVLMEPQKLMRARSAPRPATLPKRRAP